MQRSRRGGLSAGCDCCLQTPLPHAHSCCSAKSRYQVRLDVARVFLPAVQCSELFSFLLMEGCLTCHLGLSLASS